MKQKIAVVTGASSGIGKATALYLAAHNYKVYGLARRADKLQELEPQGVIPFPMDITQESSVERAVDAIIAAEGRVDILINNAGYGEYGAIENVTMEDARKQMDVNVFGLAHITQLIIPYMRKQGFGKIVNISSVGGKISAPMGGWYHASKFALEALSDSMRAELKPFGIDVIVIEPGGVKSEWADIAFTNMKGASNNEQYIKFIEGSSKVLQNAEAKSPDAIVIAELIHKAIEAPKPKARYVKGYLAKPVLFFKRWLSDAQFDALIARQIQ